MKTFCCVLPVYNNAGTVRDVIRRILLQTKSLLVVDDGSDDMDLPAFCRELGVECIRHPENRGKGEAIRTAMTTLAARNFVIDVFASGSEIHHFRTGRNTMSFESFLDLLSSLECSRSERRFEQLPGSELNRAAQAGAVFLILLRIDPEAENLYHELLRRGANLRVFTFDPGDPVPAWAEPLTCTEILENRRTDL